MAIKEINDCLKVYFFFSSYQTGFLCLVLKIFKIWIKTRGWSTFKMDRFSECRSTPFCLVLQMLCNRVQCATLLGKPFSYLETLVKLHQSFDLLIPEFRKTFRNICLKVFLQNLISYYFGNKIMLQCLWTRAMIYYIVTLIFCCRKPISNRYCIVWNIVSVPIFF